MKAHPRKALSSVPSGIPEQFQLVRILCPAQNPVAGWLCFMISPWAVWGQAGVFRPRVHFLRPCPLVMDEAVQEPSIRLDGNRLKLLGIAVQK